MKEHIDYDYENPISFPNNTICYVSQCKRYIKFDTICGDFLTELKVTWNFKKFASLKDDGIEPILFGVLGSFEKINESQITIDNLKKENIQLKDKINKLKDSINGLNLF